MRRLFIDLENTLITPVEYWDYWQFINTAQILDCIEKTQPDSVGIFSFALHSPQDLTKFNTFCKKPIETLIGRPIQDPPLVSEIIETCQFRRLDNSPVSFQELRKFWGKGEAFKQYVRNKYSSKFGSTYPQSFWLLDDEVENELFSFKDRNIEGELVKIHNS